MTEVMFPMVPNQLLMYSDLVRPMSGPFGSGLRINYVPIKVADVVHNSKIMVHSLYFPFLHLYLVDQAHWGRILVKDF